MKGVFKCAREDDKKIQECQTLKLGDAPVHPQEIFKKTQASKLGDAPVHPLLHQQLSVRLSFHYILITSCVMCYAWSVSLLVSFFSFLQLCLLFITSQNPAFFVWERNTLHFNLEHNIGFSCLSLLCVFFVFPQLLSCLALSFHAFLFKQLLFSWLLNSLEFSCLSC